jgi:hypothetical protein
VAGGAQLVVSDPVTINAGRSLTHGGAGTVTYESTFTLGGGSSVTFNSAVEMARLEMASDASADVSGSLLVADGDLAALRAKVSRGYNGGDWNGGGIDSAAAANDSKRATALGIGSKPAGVLVKYTFYGDTDLDGSVDLDDFGDFLLGYGGDGGGGDGVPATWASGDFDYSGSLDTADFDLFLRGLISQGRPIYTPQLYDALSTFVSANGLDTDLGAVPEPASLVLLAAAANGLLLRRQRGRRT